MAVRPFALGAGGGSLGGALVISGLRWLTSSGPAPYVPAGPVSFTEIGEACDLASVRSAELLAALLARAPDPVVLGVVAGLATAFGLLVGLATGFALAGGRRGSRGPSTPRREGPVDRSGLERLEAYRCRD